MATLVKPIPVGKRLRSITSLDPNQAELGLARLQQPSFAVTKSGPYGILGNTCKNAYRTSITNGGLHETPKTWAEIQQGIGRVGTAERSKAAKLADELRGFRSLPKNWDSYGAESPNATAVQWGITALGRLHEDVEPHRVFPSAEGGVVITFRRGNRYADIECYNTGEILGTLSDGTGHPIVFDVAVRGTGVDDAIEKIREYLNL
jgi:hypothetical protein